MKRILTALVLIPLVLLLVFKAPLWAIVLVTSCISLLATYEYLQIVRAYGLEPFATITYLSVFMAASPLLSYMFIWATPLWVASAFVLAEMGHLTLISTIALLIAAMLRSDLRAGFTAALMCLIAVPYLGISLSTIPGIRQSSAFWVLLLLISVWLGDTAAMYVGKAFGRHKLAPRLSPNKTWEGAIASFLASVLGG
ncbi:MAG: phosphatidate cytidylyltransferase, partial [Acidobacteriales bacterium]|nr:phosphatidate cytidylyltransferase [Terriglobales bacterium]